MHYNATRKHWQKPLTDKIDGIIMGTDGIGERPYYPYQGLSTYTKNKVSLKYFFWTLLLHYVLREGFKKKKKWEFYHSGLGPPLPPKSGKKYFFYLEYGV